jgi:hypothetical protein
MTFRSALIAVALAASAFSNVAAQASKWRLVATQDELSGAQDRRLILPAEGIPARRHTDSPDKYRGASLVVACGERLPGDSGRTLLFYAGMHLEPFGGAEHGYAEWRFAGEPRFTEMYLLLLDYGETVVQADRTASGRHTAFLGSRAGPYYSDSTLARLTHSERLTVRFRPLGAPPMTVEFDLKGLRESLPQLGACRWPSTP